MLATHIHFHVQWHPIPFEYFIVYHYFDSFILIAGLLSCSTTSNMLLARFVLFLSVPLSIPCAAEWSMADRLGVKNKICSRSAIYQRSQNKKILENRIVLKFTCGFNYHMAQTWAYLFLSKDFKLFKKKIRIQKQIYAKLAKFHLIHWTFGNALKCLWFTFEHPINLAAIQFPLPFTPYDLFYLY